MLRTIGVLLCGCGPNIKEAVDLTKALGPRPPRGRGGLGRDRESSLVPRMSALGSSNG
jgi:hypothetical protein